MFDEVNPNIYQGDPFKGQSREYVQFVGYVALIPDEEPKFIQPKVIPYAGAEPIPEPVAQLPDNWRNIPA